MDLTTGVSSCSACTGGEANPTPGGTCAPCTLNTASTNGVSCDTCSTGYHNSAAAGSAVATCTSCAAGYFLDGSSCSVCAGANVNPDNNNWGACCTTSWDATNSVCAP